MLSLYHAQNNPLQVNVIRSLAHTHCTQINLSLICFEIYVSSFTSSYFLRILIVFIPQMKMTPILRRRINFPVHCSAHYQRTTEFNKPQLQMPFLSN